MDLNPSESDPIPPRVLERKEPWDWPTPVSAYIHVPFCRHRCGYCNFSVVAQRSDLIDRFIQAVDVELSTLSRPSIQTLFIGGGTPTHLGAEKLDRFLGLLEDRFEIAEDAERTVEANPEDIDDEKIAVLARHRINRVSLGVQSFDGDKLACLQRGHSGDQAAWAVRRVAEQIENVSIDLIFGAPGESVSVWRSDLESALALPLKHLSTYSLTYERGTSFWSRRRKGELTEVGEDNEVEMYQLARQMTMDAGMGHYEVSSFSRPGWRCQHNLAYWRGQGWYAAGPGATKFIGGRREENHRSTFTYLKRIESGEDPVDHYDAITPIQYAHERLAFGVRMIDGVDLKEVSRECGIDLLDLCRDEIERMCDQGWLAIQDGRMKLTSQGILFADSVAAELLG